MNKEIKEKWVEALRSGHYAQGKRALKEEGCYCCLGVLQVVCKTSGIRINKMSSDEYLCAQPALKKIDLTFSEQVELAGMNDDGKTFAEIADYIEQEL